ncbi:MAG TPA: T9SS type A sorting domain-containing protein [Bacteroidota bacterium]|nr:T9SS type A sorting domain-containing protein [Bacteroidota bacterium]
MRNTIKNISLVNVMLLASSLCITVGTASAGTSARDHKQLARDYLLASINSETQENAAGLKVAVEHLEKSLNPELWRDSYHLVKKGEKVFDEERDAAHSLIETFHIQQNDHRSASGRSDLMADIITCLGLLVRADSTLALTALNELILGCQNDKCQEEIGKAQHYLNEIQKLSGPEEETCTKQIELYKKVWQHSRDGMEYVLTDNLEGADVLPAHWTVHQNYPNPFNPFTIIRYSLPVNSFVSIKIYNVIGQNVTTLVDQEKDAGSYSVEWNGERYPSGVYFYRFQAGTYSETKRLLLLK